MAKRLKRSQVVYKGCYALSQVVKSVVANVKFTSEDGKVSFVVPVPSERVVNEKVPVLVKLRLPKGARVNLWPKNRDQKARADRAEVLSIKDKSGRPYQGAMSKHVSSFKYVVGKVAKTAFDRGTEQCSGGIHFYRGTERAWAWVR